MVFKDLFSGHADDYKRFRPNYPDAFFQWLAEQVTEHHAAWDCGTGNGQGAVGLANYFDHIYATDASEEQIRAADVASNISYGVAPAEHSGLKDQSVSLVTVFQALHWFALDKFFEEVQRVLRPDGVLAVIGYNTAITGVEQVDATYREFCFEYLWEKQCWAMERKSLNASYEHVEFPFNEINAPEFLIEMHWNYQDYLSYLNTWSAVKTYIKKYGKNPIEQFVVPRIEEYWPDKDQPRLVKFPVILRVMRQ